MPGWHKITAPLEAEGKRKVLGIAQEQHGDRTRLFMQWKQMDWPVHVDAYNLYGVSGVPITLFVDEHGIIRKTNPKPEDLNAFLDAEFPPPDEDLENEILKFDVAGAVRAAVPRCVDVVAENWIKTKGGSNVELSAEDHFRFGVLRRMRHDSEYRRPHDFADAVHHWSMALAKNPNQYIWRRRIQQYGPRLDKPYPFYDWIPVAREEILARGETPVPLVAEPSGAEIAQPARNKSGKSTEKQDGTHPDPDGKLHRDTAGLVNAEAVVVSSTSGNKPGYRVHLTFTPDTKRAAHWNNESGEAAFWLEGTAGWNVSAPVATLPVPEDPDATSEEVRTVEFEVFPDGEKAATTPGRIRGTLLFYVCEGADGVCRYLAKDIEIAIHP